MPASHVQAVNSPATGQVLAGRWILTLSLLVTLAVTLGIDWTVSHVADPTWPAHARYHILLYHGTMIVFCAAAFWWLWGPSRNQPFVSAVACLVLLAFWLPFFPAALYPDGSIYATQELADHGVPINLILAGMLSVLGLVGYWLARPTIPKATAATVRRAGDGRAVWVVGDLYSFLAEGEDTGGMYALWEAVVPPGGGPPPHVHAREEEGFYVLEGEITFHAAGQEVKAGPGTFLNLPRGVPHHFKNQSDSPARLLILVAPAGLEKMFFRTGTLVQDRAATPPRISHEEIQRLLAIAPEYGIQILLPQQPSSRSG